MHKLLLSLVYFLALARWTDAQPAPDVPPAPAPAAEVPYADQVWAALTPAANGLTAAQAAASAQRSSPSVEVAKAQVEASLARSKQTLSRYVPNVTAKADYTRRNAISYDLTGTGFSVGALNEGALVIGTCPDGVSTNCVVDTAGVPVQAVAAQAFEIPLNNYSIQANLSVPFSDYALALSPARKGAAADEAAARLRQKAELETVGVNARIAYYDWIRAQAQITIAEQTLVSARARLRDAQSGVDAGTVTAADALGVESLVATSQLAVEQAKSFLRMAEKNLVITAQWEGPLAIGEDVSQPSSNIQTLGTLDDLIERAQKQRFEAQAHDKAMSASQFASDGASAAFYPRVDGIANVTHANPNQGFFPPGPEWNTSWYVGLSASWRLDGFLNTKAQVRELDANTQVLRAQRTSLDRAIELEVRGAWEEWQRAEAAVRISKTEIKAAVALHEQRVLLFRAGEVTSTDVVEVELQRHNAALRKVNAVIDKRIAIARMRRAAALPFPEATGR